MVEKGKGEKCPHYYRSDFQNQFTGKLIKTLLMSVFNSRFCLYSGVCSTDT